MEVNENMFKDQEDKVSKSNDNTSQQQFEDEEQAIRDSENNFTGDEVNILLVEDNFINQKLACTLLEKEGWKVTVVSDGKSALAYVDKSAFDLILMDIQMPLMDGFEVARQIREREKVWGGHVPIIGMTANVMKEDIERCIKSGMDDHIPKPFDIEEFYRKVKKYLVKRPGNGKEVTNAWPVDLSALTSISQGDDSLVKEFVKMLLEAYPGELEQIREAILKKDFVRLEKKAHSFRGSLLNYRANKACSICLKLEEMGRNKNMDNQETVFEELKEEMENIRIFLSGK